MAESDFDKLVNALIEQVQAHLTTAKNEQRLPNMSELNVLSMCLERLNNILLLSPSVKIQQYFINQFSDWGSATEVDNN